MEDDGKIEDVKTRGRENGVLTHGHPAARGRMRADQAEPGSLRSAWRLQGVCTRARRYGDMRRSQIAATQDGGNSWSKGGIFSGYFRL
jgi:hypothetical protein